MYVQNLAPGYVPCAHLKYLCAALRWTAEISETLGLDHFPGLGLDLGLKNTHFLVSVSNIRE